jgi:GNAT superfamily N-acetyltransferase
VAARRSLVAVIRRAGDVRVVSLATDRLPAAAALMANEHGGSNHAVVTGFGDEDVCRSVLSELLADGFDGFAALVDGELAGVMCVRAVPPFAFVPAHGLAIRVGDEDPTSLVVAMLAAATSRLLDAGATRLTIDHIAAEAPGLALHDAGFGRSSVFATRATTPLAIYDSPVRIRIGTHLDLESIAELSHIEFQHRFEPPVHALERKRSTAQTREIHAAILEGGGIHLIASMSGQDVGLLTIEHDSPAPRLCPEGAHIGPTATRPDARGHGVGHALVAAALDEAGAAGHRYLSVDFDSANPLSRSFWLGLDFIPTGYRLHRVIRLA